MKRFVELILSNILWEIIKMTFENILKDISTSISYAVWISGISGFVILNGYLVYVYFIKQKGRYFAFPFTGKLFSFFHINNPDDFPPLNLSTLKRHILSIINNPRYAFNFKKIQMASL